ncbi:hypothetical protein E8E13_001110 [Curvularia kusanoi]|uniref:Uncharacterized protein n=1 Tax=Curvularia kusanoi TaxID=90978 RepID=A0A9P4T4B6_CURKU|nr:hypothetical protein E8E13_001110 [Curvularia kusanoi]
MSSTMDYTSASATTAHLPRPVTLFSTYQPSPPVSPTRFPLQQYPQPPPPPPPLPLPNPPPETPAKQAKQARRARTLTTTSHALTLFTVFGIPASAPLWLEYYFTTLYPRTSLGKLGAVFGALMGGLWGGYVGGMWLCEGSGKGKGKGKGKREDRRRGKRERWWCRARVVMLLSALLATISPAVLAALAAHSKPARNPRIAVWMLVPLQGAIPGLALGLCAAASMRMLRAHYGQRAGAMCHVAGWAGAVGYSVVAWAALRRGRVGEAFGLVAGGAVVTLGAAVVLARPCERLRGEQDGGTAKVLGVVQASKRGRFAVRAVTALVLPLLAVLPLFSPLILLASPTLRSPDTAFHVLVALYASAALSSSLVPHVDLLRLSRENLLAGCLGIAALATVPLIWDRGVGIAIGWALVYGAAVGGVGVGLGTGDKGEGDSRMEKGKRKLWGSVLGVVAGVVVGFGGVVGCAALMQSFDKGVEIVLGTVVGVLGLGALGSGMLVYKGHMA